MSDQPPTPNEPPAPLAPLAPLEPTVPLGSIRAEVASARGDSSQPNATDSADASALEPPQEPRALDTDEIRARKRPRTIAFVWAWELACALLLTVPIHTWARGTWGSHPDGDAAFFVPGGRALMAWVGDGGPPLAIVARTSFILLLVFAVLGQIVTGALIASLSTGVGKDGAAPRASFALRIGASTFFPMIGIGILIGAIEGFVLGVGFFISSALDHALEARLGDARSFQVRLLVLAIFVVLMLVVGVIGDLGRVVIARNAALGLDAGQSFTKRLRSGIRGALRATRGYVGRAAIAWGWRTAIALGLLYAGNVASDAVGGRGGGALWLLFFFHQAIMLGRVVLRASWLANALRFVTR